MTPVYGGSIDRQDLHHFTRQTQKTRRFKLMLMIAGAAFGSAAHTSGARTLATT